MIIRYTQNAQAILRDAKKCAIELRTSYIGTEHLLLAILATDCVGCKILNENNVFYNDVLNLVMNLSSNYSKENYADDVYLSPKLKRVIESANKTNDKFIGSKHLLYSILEHNDSFAGKILITMGKNLQDLMTKLMIAPTN